ncbi:MAG: hypothetical protein H6648_05305 [Caldilineae bacterium]|nr:hypothetical protein [Chloroflexota bacterium]MCB9176559.1 hypothetical protein [Caldilineae bacterium]
MRPAVKHARTTVSVCLLAILLGLALAPASGSRAAPDDLTTRQAGTTAGYLPDLQVPDGQAGLASLARGAVPDGMEGFGSSDIELVNLGDAENAVDLTLQQFDTADQRFERTLAPSGHSWFQLAGQLGLGRFGAIVRAAAPIGIVARTEWPNGALTAYEAPAVGRELILPMMMRGVGGHASIFNVYNSYGVPDSSTELTIEVFDPSSGAFLVDMTDALEPESVYIYDSTVMPRFRTLPTDRLGGFIGPVRFGARNPVAVMAYGDETTGEGVSAYLARPVEAASTLQLLPALRAKAQGSSLVAIANVSRNDPVEVELDYRGVAPGDGGRAVGYRQSFQIRGSGAAYLDLADRGRGNVAPPAELLGPAGFFGNLTVRASGPVLAMAQEELIFRGHLFAASAYNAFGADEVGVRFEVPRVLDAASGRSTQLLVMNPGPVAAELELGYRREDGGFHLDAAWRASVPPGETRVLPVSERAPAGSQLSLESSQPVAVLVQDTPFRAEGYWDTWRLDTSLYPALLRQAAAIPTPDPNPTQPTEPTGQPTTRPTVDPGPRPTPLPYAVHAPAILRSVDLARLPAPATVTPAPPPVATATGPATQQPPTPTEPPVTPTPAETPIPSHIRGRITIMGQPAPAGMGELFDGPQIELRRRVGGRWEREAYTVIGEAGSFSFENPAPLGPGEAYQVWWNVDRGLFLEDMLQRWMSPDIEAFGPGDTVDVGSFEVGDDLELTMPIGGLRWPLPRAFNWQPRSLATDDYRWALSRSCDLTRGDIERDDVFLSEPLGHADTYRLRELPPGTAFGPSYCWWVHIEDGSGARGWSTDYRKVGFCERFPCDP